MILNHFVVTSECKINVKANVNTIYIYIYIYIYMLLNSGSKNEKNMKNHLKFVFLCVRCGSLLALASDKHS